MCWRPARPRIFGSDRAWPSQRRPWLASEWAGAHNRDHLRQPDASVAAEFVDSGVVSLVTVAPELPGAQQAAEILASGGVIVSAGHTGATFDQAMAAFSGPWSFATHLYNRMRPFLHTDPGVVEAVFDSRVPAGLIADGLHCHPAAVRLAMDQVGPHRLVLVRDAMAATGLSHGGYVLGERPVSVGDSGPRTEDGRLAGSVLTLDTATRNAVEWLPIGHAEALRCASSNPASVLGRSDLGTIAEGARGDLVISDDDLSVVATFIGGTEVFGQTAG